MGDAADKKYAWIQERGCACDESECASLPRPPTPTALSALQEGMYTPNFNAYAPSGSKFWLESLYFDDSGLAFLEK